jgi:hypothetical protein
MPTREERIAYYRQAAAKRGIDPEYALRVAGGEGLNSADGIGDGGSSFGDWQLHYAGINPSMPNAGLGDEFTAKTGLHASDPNTWMQQADFALDYAAQHGWGSWMGAAASGVGEFDGIKGTPRVSGPVEAAGGGAGSDPGPQLYTPPTPAIAIVPPLLTAPPTGPVDTTNPWASIGSGLASAVRPSQSGIGTTDYPEGTLPKPPDFESAQAPAQPAPLPAIGGEFGADSGGLANLFKVGDIGMGETLNLDQKGQPIRRRQYG